MNSEIEATFLDVDHSTLRIKLLELGGKCAEPLFDMKRTIYDYEDLRLDKAASWIRVRQESGKVTMGFKQRLSETIEGMREVELVVDSFDEACRFLEAVGLKVKSKQESKRETWEIDGCQVMLDEWPWIPPYVEVEGENEESVRKLSEKLGFDYNDAIFDSTDAIYQKYFDVSRTEISTVALAFGEIPEWLEVKRIKS